MIRQVFDVDQVIAQFLPVLFQAVLGFGSTEVVKNDMLYLHRRSRNRPRSIQRGFDRIFDWSDDKYLRLGLDLMEGLI